MSKHRALTYGSPVPQSFLDAMQEFIGTMASPNLVLMMVPGSANQVQIVAGAASAQVGLGIDGIWRYISATVQTTITGAAATYDIFATTGNNAFAVNPTPPPPETDSTSYAFALTALVQGSTPGTAHYRKLGEAIFDGTRVLSLRQTLGTDGAQLAQPGDIKMSAAANPAAGWLACDGSAVSRSTYAALYAALGGTGSPWGQGDGTTTFNVPDLRGRGPIGAGSGGGLTTRTLGKYGGGTLDTGGTKLGEEAHTLALTEIPSHNHGGATGTDSPDHTHSGNTGTESAAHNHNTPSTFNSACTTGPATFLSVSGTTTTGPENQSHFHSFTSGGASARHTHTIPGAGSGAAHNNMQPFVACSYFVKT